VAREGRGDPSRAVAGCAADGPDSVCGRARAGEWAGAEGAFLAVVSKKNGQIISKRRSKSLPVFDGMIAAHGKLYISLENGNLLCWE
jgi:hypothetical protein